LSPSSNNDFIVLGGGLAGVTFALEASRAGHQVVILEKEEQVGGLARTLRYGDYRFDLGGHRFHSRWPEITQWFLDVMGHDTLEVGRRSRINLNGRFVDYPLRFPNALSAFPPAKVVQVLASYAVAAAQRLHKRPDVSFEDWVVQRFGRALFEIYFRPYTEKVWGFPCSDLSADWAAERIRLPSLRAAVAGSLSRKPPGLSTLVKKFLYPPLGIGALSERIADLACQTGRARILVGCPAVHAERGAEGWRVSYRGPQGEAEVTGRTLVSTMPLERLLGLLPLPTQEASTLASRLPYRSLACVFLAIEGAKVSEDTWTYFPDTQLFIGRTHEPGNWSPRMVPEGKTSLCVEIFCSEGDQIWNRPDAEMIEKSLADLERLKFLPRSRVNQAWVSRVSHAYPVYHVGYGADLSNAVAAVGRFPDLHLLGRTGTFRYLNLDAVIREGITLAQSLCQGP
jgi:protoporphyrinogen oxidase